MNSQRLNYSKPSLRYWDRRRIGFHRGDYVWWRRRGRELRPPAAIDAVVPFFDSCGSEVLVDLMYRDDSASDGSLVALSHRYWHRRIP